MSRRRRENDLVPGQDSFLDIVSNLVGILIILVMVIGVQVKHAIVDAKRRQPTPDVQPVKSTEVSVQQLAAESLRIEIGDLKNRMSQRKIELAFRKKERDKVLAVVTEMNQYLDSARAELSRDQQNRLSLTAENTDLKREFEDLRRQQEIVANEARPTHVIKHMPTPLAQTVFGKEAHFRLKDNRIVHVPLEELVERFKEEARRQAWKLKSSPTYTDFVGPVEGFQLKYTLRKIKRTIQTRQGVAVQERVELDHFEVVPTQGDLGETVDFALGDSSEFRRVLQQYVPHKTVVTIWVYPDSFGAFRQVKDSLATDGFLAAGRPLPTGQLISGSPEGTRSAAQ